MLRLSTHYWGMAQGTQTQQLTKALQLHSGPNKTEAAKPVEHSLANIARQQQQANLTNPGGGEQPATQTNPKTKQMLEISTHYWGIAQGTQTQQLSKALQLRILNPTKPQQYIFIPQQTLYRRSLKFGKKPCNDL